MHLAGKDLSKVTEVLLPDGWHQVETGSFGTSNDHFAFTELVRTVGAKTRRVALTGAIETLLAVREPCESEEPAGDN